MVRERWVIFGLFSIPLLGAAVLTAWSPESRVLGQTTRSSRPLVSLVGLVQPSDVVDLASSEKGIIEEMAVDEGTVVKKGQVVCKLESRVEEASLRISQAQAESEIDIEVAKLRHELAQIEYDRVTKLEQQQAAAIKEIDTARINEKYSAGLVRKAQHDQQVAKFQYVRDQKVLERRTITSPLDGYVAKKNKSVGELVDGVNDAVVCQIVRLDPLHVLVPIPADTYGQIRVGDRATVTAEQLPQGKATAKVILVDRLVQADSQTYTVKLELPNPDGTIPAGIKVEASFP